MLSQNLKLSHRALTTSLGKCVRHSSSWIRSNFRHFTRTKKIKLSIKLQFHVMCSPTKTKSKTHQNNAVAHQECQFHGDVSDSSIIREQSISFSLSRNIIFENFLDRPCHVIFTSDDQTHRSNFMTN